MGPSIITGAFQIESTLSFRIKTALPRHLYMEKPQIEPSLLPKDYVKFQRYFPEDFQILPSNEITMTVTSSWYFRRSPCGMSSNSWKFNPEKQSRFMFKVSPLINNRAGLQVPQLERGQMNMKKNEACKITFRHHNRRYLSMEKKHRILFSRTDILYWKIHNLIGYTNLNRINFKRESVTDIFAKPSLNSICNQTKLMLQAI